MRQVIAHLFSSLDGYASDRNDEDMRWAMSRQGIQQLRQGQQYVEGGDIGLSGSVEVLKSLLRTGELDHLLLQVYPVILGSDGGSTSTANSTRSI
jgi:riboflavin biosynthesis pyrimidine reductase